MINVHNVMEELVSEHVNQLYDQIAGSKSPWLTCDCETCRLDTMSYVLNRIQPRYVVGGRGITHTTKDINEDNQINADLDKLCIEGMKLVNSAKRPYHKEMKKDQNEEKASKAEFHFPTFSGNIYDGNTFEPLSDASVTLLMDGAPVEMMDVTWQNPCRTYGTTKGSYSFWMTPQEAVSTGMNKKFSFSIEVTKKGYTPVSYSFTVPLVSEENLERQDLGSTFTVKIKDIFLFREDEE